MTDLLVGGPEEAPFGPRLDDDARWTQRRQRSSSRAQLADADRLVRLLGCQEQDICQRNRGSERPRFEVLSARARIEVDRDLGLLGGAHKLQDVAGREQLVQAVAEGKQAA
jgi:hypothetical protein